ncbi:MAG: HNH endonuclease [Kiritimatiellae bacterium]|nr:HNH endonuclease [Kiritimatiellia bacterium]
MNAYLFSSIQSAAYGNLFECSTHEERGHDVVFSSMSHENEVGVMDDGEEFLFTSLLNTEGLKAKFPKLATEDGLVVRHPKNDLTNHLALLGELFHAAATLPPDPNAVLPERTVRIATVRARLGQHRYKVSQAEMWGNACAVTGITEPALLRASHAKPWADANDAERLDPANGFPLVVHLDALFDTGLISFDSDGSMMISPRLGKDIISLYGLSNKLRLRNPPTKRQEEYLQYHRKNVFLVTSVGATLRCDVVK